MRRTELFLIAGLAVAVTLAAIVGSLSAPDDALEDARRSVHLAGPAGASALREALERFDVATEERRTALFDLQREVASDDTWLMLLDLTYFPSRPELVQVVGHVARGGRVLVAGQSGVEHCFGYSVIPAGADDYRWVGVAVTPPGGVDTLPDARWVLNQRGRDTTEQADIELLGSLPSCDAPPPADTVPLLRTTTGRFVAVRLEYASGGRVILLAEADLVANEALRDTDAGVVVLEWLLADRPERVVFDEYHQGFGEGGSLFVAAGKWLLGAPAGWTLLQVAGAALVMLWVLGLRFGPAGHIVERKRRSVMEHVQALAMGLERAGAHETAVRLVLAGLRRRFGRAGRPRARDLDGWLTALELAARTPEARTRVRHLASLIRQPGGDQRVLEAATAVEDVWSSLGRVNGSKKYSAH
jgi:hypothetical protein